MLSWIFVGINILGSILNVFKNRYSYVLWLVGNIGYCIIGIYKEDYPQVVLFSIYSITSIIGLYNWFKK